MTATVQKTQHKAPDNLADLKLTPPAWNWQGAQQELAEKIANSPKRVIMLEAECGTGKSLIPLAAARMVGVQAHVLIRTIQLQEQYLRDINDLVMLTGRSRYMCDITGGPADTAPCVVGMKCHLKGLWSNGKPISIPECSYFRQKANAIKSQFAILNYAYWLREIRGNQSSFDKVDWIICDEAHEIEQVLMDAGVIQLRWDDLREFINARPASNTIEALMRYAKKHLSGAAKLKQVAIEAAIDAGLMDDPSGEITPTHVVQPGSSEARVIIDAIRKTSRLHSALEELATLEDINDWAYVEDSKFIEARPIYGKPAFKKLLACATDKVILMSAFLAPKALIKNLGLTEDDVEVIYAPEVYDRRKSPIVYCPTVKMGYKTSDSSWNYSIEVIDIIADMYKNHKGIIHVPSVSLRDKIVARAAPATRQRLIVYDGVESDVIFRKYPTKEEALERFVSTDEPAILLGQSVSTGIDLPHVPKWQIITKLAFPPTNDPAIAKRHEVDKLFMSYITICELVQAAGRIKRATTHDGPTFILDANFGWFESRMRDHFPMWFRKALVKKGWDRFLFLKKQLPKIALRNGVIVDD